MKIEDLEYDLNDIPVDEENFNLDDWRLNNPVDYFKMMYIINTSPSKDEIFKLTYKILRMYIPDTLFKYYSLTEDLNLNKLKLESLKNNQIFMTEVKYLNDPFDNKAYFYDHNELKHFERLAPHNGRLIDDFSHYFKVSSLTSNNMNNMPMWAHYSYNHQGFCVSYDMKDNVDLFSCTFPVQYTRDRIDITSFMKKQTLDIINIVEKNIAIGEKQIIIEDLSIVYMSLLFSNIKHSTWEYENEFRCSIGATKSSYVKAKPKEIYIGMNCTDGNTKLLTNIAKTLNIPIYKMSFNELNNKFDLTSNKIHY